MNKNLLNSIINLRIAVSLLGEKELEKLSTLDLELKNFKEELLRIAKFWEPNLNDGVQITAVPLWKLFKLTTKRRI